MDNKIVEKLSELIEAHSERANDYEKVAKNIRRTPSSDLANLYEELSKDQIRYKKRLEK